jgi:hypothetical protein
LAYRCWSVSASSVGVILATGLHARPKILTDGVESTANTAACTRRPSRSNSMACSNSATTLVTSGPTDPDPLDLPGGGRLVGAVAGVACLPLDVPR